MRTAPPSCTRGANAVNHAFGNPNSDRARSPGMSAAPTLVVLPSPPRAATMPRMGSEATTDGDLIVRIAGGDRSAFEELYRRYARPVLGLALRRIGDRGRAEDAAQDAFVAIWRSARTYNRNRGGGAPWLYAVARNAITDGLRKTPE